MRPLLTLVLVVLAFVGLTVVISSMGLYNAEKPLAEKYAEEEAEKARQAQQNQNPPQNKPAFPTTAADRDKFYTQFQEGAIRARMELEGKGSLILELYPKAAPKTVEHFVELAGQKFYDGMLIHRLQENFVIQTGDPKSREVDPKTAKIESGQLGSMIQGLGEGGSGKTVLLEANLPHIAYSLGLARGQDPNSGDSQFYINLQDNAQLDGQYCAFGRVVEGKEVVKKIQLGDRIKSLTIETGK